MSKLIVEIQPIIKIEPHPNADRLEVATIKGWQCIVGKDQHFVGELVIFVPPDAILPEELIERLKLDYLKKGGRVKVTKLRGFVSQGLVLSLGCLPVKQNGVQEWQEGEDVADLLKITKWEPPAPSYHQSQGFKQIKKSNPNFNKYTDIENIKHFPNIFKDGDSVVITEKTHGANWRCGYLPIAPHQNWISNLLIQIKKLLGHTHEFVYGSHNVQLQWFNRATSYYKRNIYWDVIEKYKIVNLLKVYPGVTLYGEVYGAGVQDLTYGLTDVDLVIFDIKDERGYWNHEIVELFCKRYGIPLVPVLYKGNYTTDLITKYTKGNSTLAPNQIREGVVIKSLEEKFHPQLGRKILKSISEDYLTRTGNTTEFT